jgi:shikimate kinase
VPDRQDGPPLSDETDHGYVARPLILVGASGSGKTVIGRRASERSGWRLFDTDAEILRSAGVGRVSEIFDRYGEEHFRALETRTLDEAFRPDGRVVIATGGGLPAIPGMMEHLNQRGVTIYLKASLRTLWKRLSTDPKQLADRPLLRSGGKDALERLLDAREDVYRRASVTLDTDQLSVDEVCALLLAQIQFIETGIEA